MQQPQDDFLETMISDFVEATAAKAVRAYKLNCPGVIPDREIFRLHTTECGAEGEIEINPGRGETLDFQTQLQPASFDFRLGNTFATMIEPDSGIIKLDSKVEYKTIEAETFLLMPKQFVLATSAEWFGIPENMVAFVEGRSSLGRLGLFIQNAGFIDPGFKGTITLELFNASNFAIELKAGRRIGQVVFQRMTNFSRMPYQGKYQGQGKATGSKINEDRESTKESEADDLFNAYPKRNERDEQLGMLERGMGTAERRNTEENQNTI